MSWTLCLAVEILEDFEAVARRAWWRARQGRSRREFAFDHREEGMLRDARRHESKCRRRKHGAARVLVVTPVVEIAKPAIALVGCIRCRREVEIREGCAAPVRHEPCSPRKAGSNTGRRKKQP